MPSTDATTTSRGRSGVTTPRGCQRGRCRRKRVCRPMTRTVYDGHPLAVAPSVGAWPAYWTCSRSTCTIRSVASSTASLFHFATQPTLIFCPDELELLCTDCLIKTIHILIIYILYIYIYVYIYTHTTNDTNVAVS